MSGQTQHSPVKTSNLTGKCPMTGANLQACDDEFKRPERNCIYNRQCGLNSGYKGLLTAFKCDKEKALCNNIPKICTNPVSIIRFCFMCKI